MIVALTGTPGVGKTTLAALLASPAGAGAVVVDLKAWAKKTGCVVGHDERDGSDVIDVDRLLEQELPDGDLVVVEGHLAHLLDVDEAWVLRCDPRVLRGRLEARGYPPGKVTENLEAEALDLILMEALDSDARVVQVDVTERSPADAVEALLAASTFRATAGGEPLADHAIEHVDWSDQLPF